MMPTETHPIAKNVDKFLKEYPAYNKLLWSEIIHLRNIPMKKSKIAQQQRRDRPVAVSTRPDRLRDRIGTEICIIFRSRGCIWAQSNAGGCSMCGYINDRALGDLTDTDLWQQFEFALLKVQTELIDPQTHLVVKLFTSGSFFDPGEFSEELQQKIIKKLTEYPSIQEIVVESRPQFITEARLAQFKSILTNQYFEVGIGLESSNDFVRINIINKGFTWNEFLRAKDLLHRFGFGVKAYLLFKPPFLEEYTAILDTYRSIRHCIEVGVDTISVNPTNIQMHTLCEELFNDNLFRPPWLYSLLILFKRALTPSDLRKIRIISDPSAAGKVRGINNGPNAAVNADFLQILQQFVLTQDLTKIPEFFSGANTLEYYTQLLLGNK